MAVVTQGQRATVGGVARYPGAHPGNPLMAALNRAHETTVKALVRAHTISLTPVEPGVTGKERRFQQNRNFGPGPVSPYPHAPGRPSAPRSAPYAIPSGGSRQQRPYYT